MVTKLSLIVPFVLILVLAFILRFHALSQLPYALDGDEAAFGYYAFTLSHRGTDEYGNKLPLYFPSIGDYKFPAYAYLSTPWVTLFSLSELSTRFTSVIAGLLTVISLTLLVSYWTKNFKLGLLTALVSAITPTLVVLSRGAYESNLGLALACLTLLFFSRFLHSQRKIFFFLANICFLLGLYSYSATRLFLSLATLILTCLFVFIPNHRRWSLWFLLLSLVGFVSFLPPQSRVRAENIGILTANQTVRNQSLAEQIHEDGIAQPQPSLTLTRVLHNKPLALGLDFTSRYLSHFDPNFLFFSSGLRSRYTIPHTGLLLLIQAPLLLTGLISLRQPKYARISLVILLWLLLGPIPAALAIESPDPVRFLIAVPPLVMLSSIGITELPAFSRKLPLLTNSILFLVIGLNLLWATHNYLVHKTYHQPWHSDGGMRELVHQVTQLKSHYQAVVLSGDPYIFFAFFNRLPAPDFLNSAVIEPSKGLVHWERVSSWTNVIFKSPTPCPKIGKLNHLYVCTGVEIPLNAKVISLIRFLDHTPAFTLIEFQPLTTFKPDQLPEGLNRMVETDLRFNPDGLLPPDYPTPWL